MRYLLNEYYLCTHFEPAFYKLLFLNNNKHFEKFWFEILENNAYNGDWKQYTTIVHPRFGYKITTGSMIVKFNLKSDVQVKGIFHPPKVYYQQVPRVDSSELPNPFLVGHHFINNDPYYDNHDPDLDLDDDWYQGRDG